MVNRSLNEVVCGISSGTTTNHQVKGTYVVYGSTGIIGYTDNPDYYGEKVLVARVGANAGTTNIVCGKYGVSDNTLIVEVNPENETKYIYYSLKYKKLNQLIFGSGQPLITGSLLKNITLYIPDKNSQKCICDVLSDVDSLISSLEKLIAKEKAVKQGAMQELLTGKKRLPGFDGEWKHCYLSQLGIFIKGSGISRDESNSGTLLAVRYGELYTKHNNYITKFYSHISEDVANDAKRIYYGDILFAASGETKEEIGKCAAIVSNEEVYAGGDILIFRPFNDLNPLFMGTVLNMPEAQKQRAEKGQGDAVVHIHADDLGKMSVYIPEFEEQTAIASVLSDMDNEIEALEQKLTKTRQVKQGIMQQLLTGKIRLV